MSGDDNSWRTEAFRQSVVAKIDEAIQKSGMPTSKNSNEMESHVFQKAKTREEYLGFVARLILHVREMNSKKGNTMGAGGQNLPDPINALQNLARQGSGNNQMMMGIGNQQNANMIPQQQQQQQQPATTLLQTLNSRPAQPMAGLQNLQGKLQMGIVGNATQGGPMVQMPSQIQGGPMANINAQVQGQQMRVQLPTGQLSNQMLNQMPTHLQTQMSNQMQGQIQMANQMSNQMSSGMPNQIPAGMQSQILMNQMRKGNEGLMVSGQNTGFPGPRNVTPFLRQTPSPTSQSPAGLGGVPSGSQMASSPALVPSPNPQLTPMSVGPQRSVGMAPSPSSSLNTPGQAVPTPSPGNILQEEQIYKDKVKHLSRYIEPLRRMIARMGNDDVEKLSKMKTLLDILSHPAKRMPLETLRKCEVVLEKLDFKRGEGSVPPPQFGGAKEASMFTPLLDAVKESLQNNPNINHTLQRTFGPCLEALFGPELKMLPPPLKKKKVEETISDIPDVLQGEIARLDQRFKVSLDPGQQPGSRSIQLICWLDDRHLPCVPPVSVTVPEDYPKSPPRCHMSPHEYSATKFLIAVQKALTARIGKLPSRFSVSQLLDTWEMSVRQASAPTHSPVSATTVLMGL